MKVWIDQDLCTGDAQCVEICPEVFFLHDDGHALRSFVRAVDESGVGPEGTPKLQMRPGSAEVPRSLETSVIEAADYCPGECIYVERNEGNLGVA